MLPARQGKSPVSTVPRGCAQWHATLHALSWLCCCWHPGDAHPSLPLPPAAHRPSTTQLCPSRPVPAPLAPPPLGCHGSVGCPGCSPLGAGDSAGGRNTPQAAWGGEEEWEGGRETGQPTAQLGRAGSPPWPHHPIYYPSAIHRARQMPPNKYPQTIGWEGPVRLLMNKHDSLWTQLPLFAKWDQLCSRHLKFSRGRAVFQCPPNCRGASFIS